MKKQIIPEPEKMPELLQKFVPGATEEQREMLIRFYVMLIEKNNVMNLTAITDPEGVAARHFADSLLASELIPEGAKVIDVGTGAGFPGIPLAVMRPDLEITLLDSLNKRVNFLDEVSSALALNIKTVHARAEDGAKMPSLREKFDFVLSRAVAEIPVLAEWTLPFAKVGGCSVMYKGPGAEAELASVETLFAYSRGRRNCFTAKRNGAKGSSFRSKKPKKRRQNTPARQARQKRIPFDRRNPEAEWQQQKSGS
ncbi:MAG: 16S rRNA (guanine(527)-N(7))-methyltransferase RsmG [Clostridia bacterium]|nr:16S rRNA (guanine(527)-N(7))-methyltransferase RsmG [Clostridia bacterium]